ncbi:MAG: type IV pilus biogenesis/stability protein PilW [Alteromonadaceae bacterium]|nr:type IV pilus biogenesis/stability protein PilW [Alteromonadaceae bacterium]
MDKFKNIFLVITTGILLSGCVSQNYVKNIPVVENSATQNEIAMTRISLGLGYLKMGNTEQAKLNLEKAKRFAPKLTQVYTAFAHYYETVGEPELAATSYVKALSFNTNDADTLNNFGVFLCRQQRFKEAEVQILKAIAVPSYILVAKSYENLALCQLKALQFDNAEIYFNKAILHSPSDASILLQMVQLQYVKGSYKEAELYLGRYEKATRRFSPQALALAYKVYEKQFNRRIAKNYAGMLVSMFPGSYEAKQFLLNGLKHIEADKLAQDYKVLMSGDSEAKVKSKSKVKKRVVVLSPRSNDQNNQVANSRLKQKNEDIVEKTVVKPGEADSNNQQVLNTLPVHIVKKGEVLFSISKKYNIRMNSILLWNGISASHILHIGDVINLADPKKADKS